MKNIILGGLFAVLFASVAVLEYQMHDARERLTDRRQDANTMQDAIANLGRQINARALPATNSVRHILVGATNEIHH